MGNDYGNICHIEELKPIKACHESKQVKLQLYCNVDELYENFDEASFKLRKPYKDKWYVNRRYFNHPIYKYKLYGILNTSVLVCREISLNKSKILRIVDILGDPGAIRYVGDDLLNLIHKENYEYIDLYEQKMRDEDLLAAYFVEREEDDKNIIPNYFEPYLKVNKEIWVNRMDDDSYCFKADGDQDRPNFR